MRKASECTHVLLLRGINVGGKNRLPMALLRQMVEELGGSAIRTFIQSGNVVLEAPSSIAARMPALLEQRIADECTLKVPVVSRTAAEFRKIASPRELGDLARHADTVMVGFLSRRPSRGAVAKLDPDRSPGDSFRVVGNHIYMNLPSGAARTKLTTAYFDGALDVVTTMRNWRTVCAISELCRPQSQ